MVREAEARENAKRQQKEIAKRKLDPGYQKNKMESISSQDYQQEQTNTGGGYQGGEFGNTQESSQNMNQMKSTF